MLFHLLQRVRRRDILMIAHVVTQRAIRALPERAGHPSEERRRGCRLIRPLSQRQAVVQLRRRRERIGCSRLRAVPRKARVRRLALLLCVLVLISIWVESQF